ncbi:PQQ-binding-like beta-propeller repeat protein [Haloglycomyces albus]|uniref:PQQ-binding-like beta-propeller repeat protein n=1 Tax=Haloglycomyces albus TaxID=526067 RepID=UPI00046D47AE|nr:PQQ-binding-like beta-propeller repeat protein [Haloglycomyces albus]
MSENASPSNGGRNDRARRAPVRPTPITTRNLAQSRQTDSEPPAANHSRITAYQLMRAIGMTALIAWVVILAFSTFTETVSGGTGGPGAVIGVVLAFLLVGTTISAAVAYQGARVILVGLLTALLAAGSGWLVYHSIPTAGPGSFITHREGIAMLAYAFGIVGSCLIVLAEFVVDGYGGARMPAERPTRIKVGAIALASVGITSIALIPAMHQWAEIANTEKQHNSSPTPASVGSMSEVDFLSADIDEYVSTPSGLLRIDDPDDGRTPQALTLINPETGDTHWYYRRWNWIMNPGPVFNADKTQVAMAGRRIDNADTYGVRALDMTTGSLRNEVVLDYDPGELTAYDSDTFVFADYSSPETTHLTAVDDRGQELWSRSLAQNCRGLDYALQKDTVVALADCAPAPDRRQAASYVFGIAADSGEQDWNYQVDPDRRVDETNFVTTATHVVLNARREVRVTDGPYSARRFGHQLEAVSIADGTLQWRLDEQHFGSTHTSACGGTLHLNNLEQHSAAMAAASDNNQADGDHATRDDQTIQIAECYNSPSGNTEMGVRVFEATTGSLVSKESLPMGLTPTDTELARGWVTALADGSTVVATDRSNNQNSPRCTLWQIRSGEAEHMDLSAEGAAPDWCHSARLRSNGGSVVVSYAGEDGTMRHMVVR